MLLVEHKLLLKDDTQNMHSDLRRSAVDDTHAYTLFLLGTLTSYLCKVLLLPPSIPPPEQTSSQTTPYSLHHKS